MTKAEIELLAQIISQADGDLRRQINLGGSDPVTVYLTATQDDRVREIAARYGTSVSALFSRVARSDETVTITLPRKLAEHVYGLLKDYDDEGPHSEGWQSEELLEFLRIFKDALSAKNAKPQIQKLPARRLRPRGNA